MSKRRIRTRAQPRDGIERWRCPSCKKLTTELVFQRPTDAQPVPPDPVFACRTCSAVFGHRNGKILLGNRAARAVLQVLRIQGKI